MFDTEIGKQFAPWIEFSRSEQAHPAAQMAWLHAASRGVLVEFWIVKPNDGSPGMHVELEYWLFMPRGGGRFLVYIALTGAPPCFQTVTGLAEALIGGTYR